MAFRDPVGLDLLWDADTRRESVTLTAEQVRDLLEEIPGDDDILDRVERQLAAVDVSALKISRKAQDAILAALGFEPCDGWPSAR